MAEVVAPDGSHTYIIAPAELAVSVVVFKSPVHILGKVEVTETVGAVPPVEIITVSEFEHPAEVVPVTI